MTSDNGSSFRRHNLLATFNDESKASSVKQQLVGQGVPQDRLVIKPKEQETAIEYAEMRDELEGMAASPAIGAAMTKSQTKGSLTGVVIFTAIGLALGVILGLVMGGETSTLIMTTVAFGFGGATFGFVAGGFLKPRLRADDQDKGEFEDEPVTNAPGPTNSGSKQFVLDFRTDDDQEAEKASSLLKAAEPERLDQFDGEGRVVATTEVGSGRSDASGS